mgnify:CR=1 FL=1
MLIALDYDETYTKDEELWNHFINTCIRRKHTVICVTMRYESEGLPILNTIGKKCQVYFTGRNAKKIYLDKLGIYPDIWIDDNPMWLYKNG